MFHINTAQFVNVRGAETFNANPMARASAGMVEGKLLEMKMDNTLQRVSATAQRTGDAALKR